MPRPQIKLDRKVIIKALEISKTKIQAATTLNISIPTLNKLILEHGIDARATFLTKKTKVEEDLEFEEIVKDLMEYQPEIVGQPGAIIGINDQDVLIVVMSDLHIGATSTDHSRIIKDIEFIRNTPNIFVCFNGDYTDNYSKRGYGGGIYDQVMHVHKQRVYARRILERVKDKTLWIIQGCHEEFSYKDDGFDASKYYARHIMGYWLGFGGLAKIVFNEDIWYDIYATHVPPSSSKQNLTLGLKKIYQGGIDFDIGISAHFHTPAVGVENIRGKEVVFISGGSYKRPDRYALKSNMSLGRQDPVPIPGFILRSKEKKAIPFLNFRDGVDYL